MKKIIAALFIGMILVGSASAGAGYDWQTMQNLELDGNLTGNSEC